MAMARGPDSGEIDIRVSEMRIEFDGASRHALGAVVFALVQEQVREVAVGLRVVRSELKGCAPPLLRLCRQAEALQSVAEVVERLGVTGL